MEKTYKYKNATVRVRAIDTYDRKNLKRSTEDFLKKVMNGGQKYGDSNTSGNFGKEQILHR